MLHDVRHALRLLRNHPGFSAVAMATIALAIGANTAMFSFVNGLLLRPLPYPESDRIVRLLEKLPTGGRNGISTLNYLDWAKQNTVFESIAAEAGWRATLTGSGEPTVISGARVSAHYFDIFGTAAALGRTFRPADDQPGNDRVVLLSHALWETRFGSDPALIGRNIFLDGESHTVIGVLPAGPFDRTAARIFKPLAFQPANVTRDFRWLAASAKLRPGVTLRAAQAEMDTLGRQLSTAYPDTNKGWGITVDRLADVVVGPSLTTAVKVLFAATLSVLLIGCVNLANLALARGLSREREIAVRAALGASRRRLVQQLLIENVVIAACGGIAGIGVGYAMLHWVLSLIPASALPPAVEIRLDGPVLAFTMTAAVATGLLFGVAPALRTTDPSLVGALKEGGHGATSGVAAAKLRSGLVVAEVALAFVLLVGSGLLMRSFLKLLDIDPGFTAANVLTAGLPIDRNRYPDPRGLNAYLEAIRAAVGVVPGVQQTALTSALPLQGWGYGVPYSIGGRAATDRSNRRRAFFKIVSPSYFDTLDIKLRAGRLLQDTDAAGAPRVALINEALAKHEFGAESPIGKALLVQEILPGRTELGQTIAWEIVGVVAGERINDLGDEFSAGMYVSNQQSPAYDMSLVMKASVAPESLERAARAAVDNVNKDQALSDVRTLDQIVDQSMLANRVMSTLLAAFAGVALVLAAVGIFGVMSYIAAQRTHEMGIRAALGASAGSLRRLMFQRGLGLTLTGVAIGLVGMLPATDVLTSMLYGIDTHDPLTLGVVAGVLVAVAVLACWLPARRVTRADPMEALRYR